VSESQRPRSEDTADATPPRPVAPAEPQPVEVGQEDDEHTGEEDGGWVPL
jgi:hypothetical protein